MDIVRFSKENESEYKEFINKYNNVPEFSTLNINHFAIGNKEIFLVINNYFIKKYQILAYAIIEKDLKYIYLANSISNQYKNNGTVIFIYDFMVKIKLRNKGIGTQLAKYLLYNVFKGKDIILQPDDDGDWFWQRFNFKNDEISKKITWKIERK